MDSVVKGEQVESEINSFIARQDKRRCQGEDILRIWEESREGHKRTNPLLEALARAHRAELEGEGGR